MLMLIGIDAQIIHAADGSEGNILFARADGDRDRDREYYREHDADEHDADEHDADDHDADDHDEDEEEDWEDEEEDWEDEEEDWEDEEEEMNRHRHELRMQEELLEEFAPEALAYLESINPDLYEHIVDDDEDVRDEFIDPVIHFTRMWLEWEESGEKVFEYELKVFTKHTQIRILSDEYHQTRNQKERKAIRNEINELLTELFDLEITRREVRIEQLQRELNELKDQLQKAKSNKNDQINTYLDKLTSTQTIFEP
jgi:chromosome segregation ATPase